MTTRVLIIDDHPLVCEALVWALKTPEARYDVTTACTLADGLRLLREPGCDVVLLDLGLPGCDGIEALRAVRAADAEVAVAIVSSATDPRTMLACLRAGANGFIPKTAPREVMVGAFRLVASGGKYVPPEAVIGEPTGLAAKAIAEPAGPIVQPAAAPPRTAVMPCPAAPAYAPGSPRANGALCPIAAAALPTAAPHRVASPYPPVAPYGPAARPAAPAPAPGLTGQPAIEPRQLGLTERQTDVLWLMLNGLPNKLICRRLKLAEGTVKVHVSAVLRALGVHSRTQAVVAAGRMGLRADAPRLT